MLVRGHRYSRFEAIASRFEAIASRLEAIASRFEAISTIVANIIIIVKKIRNEQNSPSGPVQSARAVPSAGPAPEENTPPGRLTRVTSAVHESAGAAQASRNPKLSKKSCK